MKVTIEVPDDKILSVLVGARVAYWARHMRLQAGLYVSLVEDETDEPYNLGPRNKHNWTRALTVMAQKYPQHFADLMSETRWDSITGDVLIQCACFGELKYS